MRGELNSRANEDEKKQNRIKDKYGYDSVKDLVDDAKAGKLTINPKIFRTIYGAYNDQEFLAEVFSSKEFQDFLKDISLDKKKSIFDQMVEIFLKVKDR